MSNERIPKNHFPSGQGPENQRTVGVEDTEKEKSVNESNNEVPEVVVQTS